MTATSATITSLTAAHRRAEAPLERTTPGEQ